MSHADIIEVMQFFIVLWIAAFAYLVMFRRTRCDRFREDLFSIRDNLFDYMWKHQLDYEMPAYKTLRNTMNGMIRGANFVPLSLIAIYFLVAFKRIKGQPVRGSIDSIQDPSVQQHFYSTYLKLSQRVFSFLLLEGVLWVVGKPLQLFLRYSSKKRSRKQQSNRTDHPSSFAADIQDDIFRGFEGLGQPDSSAVRRLRLLTAVMGGQ